MTLTIIATAISFFLFKEEFLYQKSYRSQYKGVC